VLTVKDQQIWLTQREKPIVGPDAVPNFHLSGYSMDVTVFRNFLNDTGQEADFAWRSFLRSDSLEVMTDVVSNVHTAVLRSSSWT
ncbi:hypothetical protein RUM43_015120, partial [Polyplax serrata]